MSAARNRQLWISAHRYLGLATLFFLLSAALTGCFLCFDKRIDAWLNADLFYVAGVDPAMDPVDAIVRFEAARSDLEIVSFPLRTAAGDTIEATVAPRHATALLAFDQVFLDPHDGRVVGTRQSGAGWDRRHIVEGVFRFHSTLLAGTSGRWLMGLVAIGWLISSIIGLYLTLPRTKPFWRRWMPIWTIDRSARRRRMMLDLHRASGLWTLIAAMMLAATSMCMNFFDEAFTPVMQKVSPALPSPFDRPASKTVTGKTIGFANALHRAQTVAKARHLEWQPAKESRLPDRNAYGVMFTQSGVEKYRLLGPVTYYIDAASGQFIYADDPYHDSTGRKVSRALYPVHSGDVVGPVGIAIVFLIGLATAELCITGLYTWWKKRRSRLAVQHSQSPA